MKLLIGIVLGCAAAYILGGWSVVHSIALHRSKEKHKYWED